MIWFLVLIAFGLSSLLGISDSASVLELAAAGFLISSFFVLIFLFFEKMKEVKHLAWQEQNTELEDPD